jgi:hypothetical protein
MKEVCSNIYQYVREYAGLTQELAANDYIYLSEHWPVMKVEKSFQGMT